MRPFNRPSRRSLLVLLGLLGGAAALTAIGVIGLMPTSATTANSTKHSGGRHCVHLDIIDSIQELHTNQPGVPPADEHVGWMATWFSTDRGTTDPTVTGTGAGNFEIIDETPGQIGGIGWMDEIIQLRAGAFHVFGPYNRPAIIAGAWVTMPATGIGGDYAGMTGFGRWKLLSATDPHNPTHGFVDLCTGKR